MGVAKFEVHFLRLVTSLSRIETIVKFAQVVMSGMRTSSTVNKVLFIAVREILKTKTAKKAKTADDSI